MNFDQQQREAFRKFLAGWEARIKAMEDRIERAEDRIEEIHPTLTPAKRGPGRPKNP